MCDHKWQPYEEKVAEQGHDGKKTLKFKDGDQWSSLIMDKAMGRTAERRFHTLKDVGIAIYAIARVEEEFV